MNLAERVHYLCDHRRIDDELLRELAKGGRPLIEAALAMQSDPKIAKRLGPLVPQLRARLTEIDAEERSRTVRDQALDRKWGKIFDGINLSISLLALVIAIISLLKH